MTQDKILFFLNSAVQSVSSSIADYAVNPDCDFTRTRKLPPDHLIKFLISEGSSATKIELKDYFNFSSQAPSSSAFIQQKGKLKPEALHSVFLGFNRSIDACGKPLKYRFLAADGSTATFFSNPRFSPPESMSIS